MKILTNMLMLTAFCLWNAVAAVAAVPAVTASTSGNGVFVIHGSSLQGFGGAKVTVRYDTATLANPRVAKGDLASGGAVFLANAGTPGSVILVVAAANGFADSGGFATINFDQRGSLSGEIQSLTAQMASLSGGEVEARTRVIKPSEAEATTDTKSDSSGGSTAATSTTTDTATTRDTAAADTTTTAPGASSRSSAAGSGAAQLVLGGTPAAPTAEPAPGTPGEPPQVTRETVTPERTTAAGDPPASDTIAVASAAADAGALEPLEKRLAEEMAPGRYAYESVAEAFRSFAGARTPNSLMEIFARHTMPGIRQEPAIALSDGTSRVRLFLAPRSAGSKAPNLSLSEAKLVSLKPEPDGGWVVELLPAKGSYRATLTVHQGGAETVIPLLVAPPFSDGKEGALTESGYARFLAERGPQKALRFDLNGDGRRDYIDDYIFTANYLISKGDRLRPEVIPPRPKRLPPVEGGDLPQEGPLPQ